MLIKQILLAFVPIFVAVDVLGLVPIFVASTEGLSREEILRILKQSIVVAFLLGVVFILVGKFIFSFLGITQYDFMIAGGLFLFVFSMRDLMGRGEKHFKVEPSEFAVVPLATPLIVGPATLTTLILLVDMYGIPSTLLAFVVNILIAGAILTESGYIKHIMGRNGIMVFSRVMELLLAAIAMMLIRKGLTAVIRGM